MSIDQAGMWWLLGVLALATAVIVVGTQQVYKTRRAEASAAREEAYRRLAERSTATLLQLEQRQRELTGLLDEIRSRLAAIEKTLRDVE